MSLSAKRIWSCFLVDFSIKGGAVSFNPTMTVIAAVDPKFLVHGLEGRVDELLEAICFSFLLWRWCRGTIRREAREEFRLKVRWGYCCSTVEGRGAGG